MGMPRSHHLGKGRATAWVRKVLRIRTAVKRRLFRLDLLQPPLEEMRLRISLLLCVLCVGGGLLAATGGASPKRSHPAAKKRCHQVTKKVRGKTKRVRVCAEPSKPQPKKSPEPPTTADLVVT